MGLSALGYLGFNARDLAAWRTYGTDILGLMEVSAPDGSVRFRMDSRAWRLAVHETAEDDIAYAGFEVAERADLDWMVKRLEAAGVAVTRGDAALRADRQVLDLVWFEDPVGTRLELYVGPTETFEDAFVSPAGVTGFVTGEQGVGHIVLFAEDAAAMERFYIDLLGLRLTDIIDVRTPMGPTSISFMNCNPRHHTVAVVPAPVPRRLDHFMIEVETLDDLGRAWDRIRKSGTPVWLDIGRHTNDHMVSFYAYTPSGTTVEYGWGAREVGEDWRVVRYDSTSIWGHNLVTPPPGPPPPGGEPAPTTAEEHTDG